MPKTEKQIDQKIELTTGIEVVKAAKQLEYGEVEVVVSNSSVDRHGESISVEGIDTKQVMKNPVVLWGHDYAGLPIGKIVKLWKTGGNLMARFKLATSEYDFAETVYKMILEGFINAVSIGGIVKKWSEDYETIEKLEMIELSVVPVGAHPDALVTAKGLGMEVDTFKSQYTDFLQKSLVDKFKVLPENAIEQNIKALKNLTSALEASYNSSTDSDDGDDSEKEKSHIKKLVVARSTAKQIDKQAELIIASINKFLK